MMTENENTKTAQTDDKEEDAPKKQRFWDTWQALALFIALILLGRYFIFEPYKIPTGSMEPTLIGHEDHGDRIVTNKLAYKFGDPKRFDVLVFKYEGQWNDSMKEGSKNYIKRLVGLPGETIVISDGNLYKKDAGSGEDRILRKWETSEQLQEILWAPVALPQFDLKEIPEKATDLEREVLEDHNRRAFPWKVEPVDALGAKVCPQEGFLKVEGESTLTYAHQVSNVYVKLGRWPFRHIGCPAAHLKPLERAGGVKVRDPREKSESIRPYVPHSWSGVTCPNCGRVRFPLSRDAAMEPRIVPTLNPTPLVMKVLGLTGKGTETRIEVEILEGCVVEGDRVRNNSADPRVHFMVTRILRSRDGVEEDAKELVEKEKGTLIGSGGAIEGLGPDMEISACVDPPGKNTLFFYGDFDTVGDLKLEMEFELVAADGAVEFEVGSTDHYAGWVVSLGGPRPDPVKAEGRHEVLCPPVIDQGRRHVLSLAFVDATVVACLDGEVKERTKIELGPLGKVSLTSLARVRFRGGVNVKVHRLDLFRDLYYTLLLDSRTLQISSHHKNDREYNERERRYEARIPANPPCYMVLGDNSPSSTDSRVWGFVPEQNIIGRASLVWWPPSRWRWMR